MTMPPPTTQTALTVFFLAACLSLNPANAGVLLDNTNGGTATLGTSGYTIGYSSGSNQVRGVQFTASANLELTTLKVGLMKVSSIVNTVFAKLYVVNSNISELYSTSINTSSLTTTPTLETISLTGFSVESGKTYILGLSSSSSSTIDFLNWVTAVTDSQPTGSSGLTFDSYRSFVNGAWGSSSTNASFFLEGTPSGASVPEPCTITLAVIGAGSFATRRLWLRRRSKGSFTSR